MRRPQRIAGMRLTSCRNDLVSSWRGFTAGSVRPLAVSARMGWPAASRNRTASGGPGRCDQSRTRRASRRRRRQSSHRARRPGRWRQWRKGGATASNAEAIRRSFMAIAAVVGWSLAEASPGRNAAGQAPRIPVPSGPARRSRVAPLRHFKKSPPGRTREGLKPTSAAELAAQLF